MYLSNITCLRIYPNARTFIDNELKAPPKTSIQLKLSFPNLRADELTQIFDKLKNYKLTHLDLSDSALGDPEASVIAQAVSDHPELQKVFVSNNRIGNIGASALASAMIKRPNLEMDVTHNLIGTEGALAWVNACVSSSKSCINLSHNALGDAGAEAVAAQLGTNYKGVRQLKLTHNGIGMQGDQALSLRVPSKISVMHRTVTVPYIQAHPCKSLIWLPISAGLAIFVLPFLQAEVEVEGCNYDMVKAASRAKTH